MRKRTGEVVEGREEVAEGGGRVVMVPRRGEKGWWGPPGRVSFTGPEASECGMTTFQYNVKRQLSRSVSKRVDDI